MKNIIWFAKRQHLKNLINLDKHVFGIISFAFFILVCSLFYILHSSFCSENNQKSVSPLQNYFSFNCIIEQRLSFLSFNINDNLIAEADENTQYDTYIKSSARLITDNSTLSPMPSQILPPSPVVSPMVSTIAPTPAGPVIDLTLSIPGIGSGSGNMKPLHTTRNIRFLLYAPDVNTLLNISTPLYSINGSLTYDDNPNSPTYTSFVNHNFDLGIVVPEGQYQIAVKLDKALSLLIKDSKNDVGGEVFSLKPLQIQVIDHQTVTIGDIAPYNNEDNIMDIKDYNLLVNCFDTKAYTPSCPDPKAADLNDDGLVNGLDYNLMLLSFKNLKKQGYPVPTLAAKSPSLIFTPNPTKKLMPKKVPTPSIINKVIKNSHGNNFGIIIFIFFLIILGICGFVLYKIDPNLIHKLLPTKNQKPGENQGNELNLKKQTESETSTISTQDNSTTPEVVIANKDQLSQATSQPSDATVQTSVNQPPADNKISGEESIEADYFVKKKSDDPQKGGSWLSLTGDSGLLEGFYKGSTVTEGFARVKGVMQTDGDHAYLLVSEITPET